MRIRAYILGCDCCSEEYNSHNAVKDDSWHDMLQEAELDGWDISFIKGIEYIKCPTCAGEIDNDGE